MSGFSEVDREFDNKHGVKSTTSLPLEEYELLHSEAVEKMLKGCGGNKGKGIDLEIMIKKGNKVPMEVTVLPSWCGSDFPFEELPIKKERIKKTNQWFAYFNSDLTQVTVVTPKMMSAHDGNGVYHIPKTLLKFYTI